MEAATSPRPKLASVAAAAAVLFGGLTLFSGGAVLFADGPARVAAGAYMPLVLWFNFLAGFAYILAGIGLYLWRGWAVTLSLAIAGATLAVFAIFGWHILDGGAYEVRTLAAMALRSAVWLTIGLYARKAWTGQAWKGKTA